MWVTVLLLSILEALYKKKNSFPTMSGVGEEKREEKKQAKLQKYYDKGTTAAFRGGLASFNVSRRPPVSL